MTDDKKTKRTGRPRKAAKSDEKVSLGLRVSGSLKAQLEEAADRNGNSQSQEAEDRLRASFLTEDAREDLDLLFRIIGIQRYFFRDEKNPDGRTWRNDPEICAETMGWADAYFRYFGPQEIRDKPPPITDEARVKWDDSLRLLVSMFRGGIRRGLVPPPSGLDPLMWESRAAHEERLAESKKDEANG